MTTAPAGTPTTVRVAAAQYPLDRLPDMAALKAKLARWVGEAAAGGAELVVFPEYGAMEIAGTCEEAVSASLQRSLAAVADRLPEVDDHLAGLARQHRIHILAPSGPARRADGAFVNAARLIAPGKAIGVQEKLIMTPFERDWGIAPGRPLRVFETTLGRIGVLICYDCEFPLLGRALVEAGVRLILVPSCTERVSGYNRVRTGALARALEGTLATVTSPTVGEAPWSPAVDRNAGAAGVFVPAEHGVSDTGVLAEGRLNEPGLVHATISFEGLERLKRAGEMRNVADWPLQPGVPRNLPVPELVDLR
jgi:predicted amidohydrolase